MPVRQLIRCTALVLALISAASWARVERSVIAASPAAAAAETSGAVTRYYSLTIRFRPFLFWMTRGNVGGARISWSQSPGPDKWVELLVGSDPERAPMSINRWGFMSERTQGDTTLLTGIMTETDEEAIDGARGDATAIANGRAFRVIRSTIRNDDAATSVGRLIVDTDVTYRHYAALLDRFPGGGAVQHTALRPGIETGFLSALRDLVRESAVRGQRAPAVAPDGLQRNYVYAGKMYRLSLSRATRVNDAFVAGRSCGPATNGEFHIRDVATGTVTSFRMMFGLAGPDAETPLRIVYRPRWWIELVLDLVDGADASIKTLAMSASSAPRNPSVPR